MINKAKTPLGETQPEKKVMQSTCCSVVSEAKPVPEPVFVGVSLVKKETLNDQVISDEELKQMVTKVNDISEYGALEDLDASTFQTIEAIDGTESVTSLPTLQNTEAIVETVETKTKK